MFSINEAFYFTSYTIQTLREIPFEEALRVTMGCEIHSVFEYAMEIYDFFSSFCADCSSFPIRQADRELFSRNYV
jgi:hypothetical protein